MASSGIHAKIMRWIRAYGNENLTWKSPPRNVLVIKKVHDLKVIPPFLQIIQWLIIERNLTVYVEEAILTETFLRDNPTFEQFRDELGVFRDDSEEHNIDLVICCGGDGTLLYTASLFQQTVPPIMAFHLGSLGFLAPLEYDKFQDHINDTLNGKAEIMFRSRLRCVVKKAGEEETNPNTEIESNENGHIPSSMQNGNSSNATTAPSTDIPPNDVPRKRHKPYLVLNEVVVDRGHSAYLSNIDLYIDGKHITTVQGDGLIVSTPTGSTAYAGAAGASLTHPSVPAMMITPICPHSLSFRPIVVPANVELKICISPESRNSAWVSLDGRKRQELGLGDSLRVTTSRHPVPSVCATDHTSDWFDSLAECLHWNVRKKQRQFDDENSISDPFNSSCSTSSESMENLLAKSLIGSTTAAGTASATTTD